MKRKNKYDKLGEKEKALFDEITLNRIMLFLLKLLSNLKQDYPTDKRAENSILINDVYGYRKHDEFQYDACVQRILFLPERSR